MFDLKSEHEALVSPAPLFVEIYVPVFDRTGRQVLGAIEFYRHPRGLTQLLADLRRWIALGALVFGGLSVVVFLTYFLNRPLQALEENLQFITWLGIVYNTYWTRLAYALDMETVHAEIEDATDDAVSKIKEMLDEHGKRSGARPGLR